MNTIGKIVATYRPTEVAVSVSSALARAKRAVSYGSRTKARTTRMPVIRSRRTRLTVSIRACCTRNSGVYLADCQEDRDRQHRHRHRDEPDSPTSVRSAMMMPPIMVIGAATNIVLPSSTSVWTC